MQEKSLIINYKEKSNTMEKPEKKVTLISLHHYNSQRRVDFHYLAESLKNNGWKVIFITTPLSPFSIITGDHRWNYVKLIDINKPVIVDSKIIQYTYAPFSSPISLSGNKIFDLITPFFIRYYRKNLPNNLKILVQNSDLFIMESNAGIILFDYLKILCPSAKMVYRCDDALETLHTDKNIIDYEKKICSEFDLITVPSMPLYKRFSNNNVLLQHHGIKKRLFDPDCNKPKNYSLYEKNFVFIGIAHLDIEFLKIAGKVSPNYGFHVIGPLSLSEVPNNVFVYGELPHEETTPYLVHADVGLHILRTAIGLDTYSDSLKVIQYTWCRLPIIAPIGIPSDRKHFIRYKYDDESSIREAIEIAAAFDRSTIDRSEIQDWDEFTATILNKVSK